MLELGVFEDVRCFVHFSTLTIKLTHAIHLRQRLYTVYQIFESVLKEYPSGFVSFIADRGITLREEANPCGKFIQLLRKQTLRYYRKFLQFLTCSENVLYGNAKR